MIRLAACATPSAPASTCGCQVNTKRRPGRLTHSAERPALIACTSPACRSLPSHDVCTRTLVQSRERTGLQQVGLNGNAQSVLQNARWQGQQLQAQRGGHGLPHTLDQPAYTRSQAAHLASLGCASPSAHGQHVWHASALRRLTACMVRAIRDMSEPSCRRRELTLPRTAWHSARRGSRVPDSCHHCWCRHKPACRAKA